MPLVSPQMKVYTLEYVMYAEFMPTKLVPMLFSVNYVISMFVLNAKNNLTK